jgi:hypothetical protein
MGGAPYIGARLGGGPVFVVSLSQLDVKECSGNSYGWFMRTTLQIIEVRSIDNSRR